jgi:hypothetical protein
MIPKQNSPQEIILPLFTEIMGKSMHSLTRNENNLSHPTQRGCRIAPAASDVHEIE